MSKCDNPSLSYIGILAKSLVELIDVRGNEEKRKQLYICVEEYNCGGQAIEITGRKSGAAACSTANDNPTGNDFEPAAINPVGSIALSGMWAMWEPSLREWGAFYERNGDDTERRVARALRICVGNEVRKLYGEVPNEPIPSKIADLLHRLDQ
jgi:hypothetical protein